ncbi:MAG: hypothetical protein M1812_002670 [Candelaria pacifica]|nr:MAG: hypothetical protein M1812_002670 [Candelaria pacifica]
MALLTTRSSISHPYDSCHDSLGNAVAITLYCKHPQECSHECPGGCDVDYHGHSQLISSKGLADKAMNTRMQLTHAKRIRKSIRALESQGFFGELVPMASPLASAILHKTYGEDHNGDGRYYIHIWSSNAAGGMTEHVLFSQPVGFGYFPGDPATISYHDSHSHKVQAEDFLTYLARKPQCQQTTMGKTAPKPQAVNFEEAASTKEPLREAAHIATLESQIVNVEGSTGGMNQGNWTTASKEIMSDEVPEGATVASDPDSDWEIV